MILTLDGFCQVPEQWKDLRVQLEGCHIVIEFHGAKTRTLLPRKFLEQPQPVNEFLELVVKPALFSVAESIGHEVIS